MIRADADAHGTRASRPVRAPCASVTGPVPVVTGPSGSATVPVLPWVSTYSTSGATNRPG